MAVTHKLFEENEITELTDENRLASATEGQSGSDYISFANLIIQLKTILAGVLDAVTLRGLAPQTSVTDATADRLMRVGAFGLGANSVPLNFIDVDTISENLNGYCSSCTNTPLGANGFIAHNQINSDYATQIFVVPTDPINILGRNKTAGVWSSWVTIYHSGNIVDALAPTFNKRTPIIDKGSSDSVTFSLADDAVQKVTIPDINATIAFSDFPTNYSTTNLLRLAANGTNVTVTFTGLTNANWVDNSPLPVMPDGSIYEVSITTFGSNLSDATLGWVKIGA